MIGKRRGGDEPPPLIVRKLRARHSKMPHGSWKVAYSDFMTSLLALFIVLWAAEQSPEVRSSIANYFRDPSVVQGRPNAGVLPASASVVALAHADAPDSAEDERALTDTAARIAAALEAEADLRALRDQVQIQMTREGLRIQLVEHDDQLFFEIGSAQVKPALTRLLGVVAGIVGRLPNDVVVEGHTDARQYRWQGRVYSNWELSADRANSARRVMEGSGLRERQIVRVVGFADRDPFIAADALDARNRRVSVIVRHLRSAPAESALPESVRRLAHGPARATGAGP